MSRALSTRSHPQLTQLLLSDKFFVTPRCTFCVAYAMSRIWFFAHLRLGFGANVVIGGFGQSFRDIRGLPNQITVDQLQGHASTVYAENSSTDNMIM